jgi:hypothetical protein
MLGIATTTIYCGIESISSLFDFGYVSTINYVGNHDLKTLTNIQYE